MQGVAAAASFAVENPAAAGVLTGAVAVPVVSAWYKDRFAGFAGEISAEQVSHPHVAHKVSGACWHDQTSALTRHYAHHRAHCFSSDH